MSDETRSAEKTLATLGVGAGRKGLGLLVTGGLALALAWIALSPQPAPFGMRILVLLLALVMAVVTWKLLGASRLRLELTDRALRDSAGEVLARIEDVEGVDRGLLAFKPSNGFVLRLNRRAPLRFRPGLYWSIGRRVGVGGLVHGSESKQMADALAFLLAETGRGED